MANDLAFDQIDDVFRDVGGVIGNSFDVPRRGKQTQRGFDELRIALHHLHEFDDDFAIEFIEHKLRGSTWGKMVCQLVFLEG